jgi:TolA-binding protein
MKRTLFVAGLSAMLAMPLLATSQQTPSIPGTSGGSGSRMEQQEMRRQQEEMRSQQGQTGQQQEMRSQQGQIGQQHQKHMSQDQVRQAQERLKEAGFDPGPIDGLLGKQTKEALREYQKAHGLPQTGQLDASTRDSLMVQQTGESPGGSMLGGRGTNEPRSGSSIPGSSGSNR